MTASVELTQNSLFKHSFDAQCRQDSNESALTLPNVFVTPPEEESDSPPWCCFDANRDAQPGAFVCGDFENDTFDYAAHAEDEIFSTQNMVDGEEKENVFVMRSLMQEAEHLREKLKSLELSTGTYPSTPSVFAEDGELGSELSTTPTTTAFSAAQSKQKVKRRKSLFSFKTLGRKKSREEASIFSSSRSDYTEEALLPSNRDMDLASISSACSASRKSSFFSRFKFSSKEGASDTKKSSSAYRSCEELQSSQERDAVLKRRFSIFELPRHRYSFSQPTIPAVPTAPTTMPSMNQSNSSLSTSSIPLTPDVATCTLGYTVSSATEKSSDRIPSLDTSMLSKIDLHAVENIAASLAFPSSHTTVSEGQFMLDPLHFESLQFNSDDFA